MIKYLIFFLLILTLTGCTQFTNKQEDRKIDFTQELSKSGEIAKKQIEAESFEIIKYLGVSKYEFTESEIDELPHSQIWAVQRTKPHEYAGKKIDVVQFHVVNHPLNEVESGDVYVSVFVYDEEVIAGTSYISTGEGGYYPLDGK